MNKCLILFSRCIFKRQIEYIRRIEENVVKEYSYIGIDLIIDVQIIKKIKSTLKSNVSKHKNNSLRPKLSVPTLVYASYNYLKKSILFSGLAWLRGLLVNGILWMKYFIFSTIATR